MGRSVFPALASAMASLFKKKTVDGEWGGGAFPWELEAPCPSHRPGAAVTSPRTASGVEPALAWAPGEQEPGGGGGASEAASRLCPGGAGTPMERRRPQPAWGDSPAALGPGGAAGRVAGPTTWDGETGPVPGEQGPLRWPGRGEVWELGPGHRSLRVREEEARLSPAAREQNQNRPTKSC